MRGARRAWPWQPPTPVEIVVVDGRVAVAVYADDRSVGYGSLEELLDDHALARQHLQPVTSK